MSHEELFKNLGLVLVAGLSCHHQSCYYLMCVIMEFVHVALPTVAILRGAQSLFILLLYFINQNSVRLAWLAGLDSMNSADAWPTEHLFSYSYDPIRYCLFLACFDAELLTDNRTQFHNFGLQSWVFSDFHAYISSTEMHAKVIWVVHRRVWHLTNWLNTVFEAHNWPNRLVSRPWLHEFCCCLTNWTFV
jgi:hypothetical protein